MATREIAVKKYVVKLSAEERERLHALTRNGKHPAQRLMKARILLKADASRGRRSMERQPDRRCAGHQLGDRGPNPPAACGRRRRGRADAQALARVGEAAHIRWRSGGQADRFGLLGAAQRPRAMDVAAAGRQGRGAEHRGHRQRQHHRSDAKKNNLKPHLKEQWVIPPDANAAFVAAMEDVLEVYHRPHDPACPVVCVDETSKQLIAETRVPIPAEPGRPARIDYEYQRNGTANLFMMFAPLEGWRQVKVTDRHAGIDYAQVLKYLSDTHFPEGREDHASCRTISTPTSRLRSTKPSPPRKRAGWSNGSSGTTRPNTAVGWTWLNPNSVCCRVQCLDRRIPDKKALIEEVAAWQDGRNKKHAKADWHFTAADARVKLKRLYPAFERLGALTSLAHAYRRRRGPRGAEGRCPFSPPKRLPPRTTDEIAEAVNFVAFRVPANPLLPVQPHRSRGPGKQRTSALLRRRSGRINP